MADVVTSPDGVQIAYEVQGAGSPALVFVHGWSCDRIYWAGQLEPFSRDFRVVAVDLAGHGESGLGRKDYTMPSFGADVAAVVDRLGLERVILIGHSMGGDVVVEAARRLRGRVLGLVWVDVYAQLARFRTPEEVEAFVEPFRDDFAVKAHTFVAGMFPPGSDPELVERVASDMASAPVDVALSCVENVKRFHREIPPALEELGLRTIAINSDNEPTDLESLNRFGVDVEIMPGVGHFLQMEDPERFNILLRKVVRDLAQACL